MELTQEAVKRVAELSRLELNDQEIVEYQNDLQKILKAFESLIKIPLPTELEGDARSALVLKSAQNLSDNVSRMQKDEVNNAISSQDFLRETPEREGVFVRVPAILNSTT